MTELITKITLWDQFIWILIFVFNEMPRDDIL